MRMYTATDAVEIYARDLLPKRRRIKTRFHILACLAASACAGTNEPKQVLCSDLPRKQSQTDYRSAYCDRLTAMHELARPSDAHPESVEVYRFLWFRSFHPPVVLRIDVRANGSGTITLHAERTVISEKQLESRQTGQPIDTVNALSREQVAQFRQLLVREDFWRLPSEFRVDMGFGPLATPIPTEREIVVSDGAQWVIEGQKGNRYHVSGDEGVALGGNGPVQQVGLAMIKLAQTANPQWQTGPIY